MRSKSKFNNRKIKRKDGEFDSKKEFAVWQELKKAQNMGLIKDLQRQVPFELIPKQYVGKKLIERECKYIADFTYIDCDNNEFCVLDVKSDATITPEFKIKKKLMLYFHNIQIKIIN